ncbi:protein phosphatase [Kineococcus sp. T13]|uniref:protein-tyrosine phosphatase family protein n=1 Tax=Kineococcus vitellinus TaxID=2696565 RepID=UPI001413449D|nr:protein phosphatase [Kineococcus vitellinus]NAZ77231.1 protein phosphatase [Kineococcus vitellinus]
MGGTWERQAPGVLVLPSGRLVRGRGVRAGVPPGPAPEAALYLLARRPAPTPWPSRWVRWPDFWLPTDRVLAQEALRWAWCRAQDDRVEVACGGGAGRTGTALACLAVLDGLPARAAVAHVREGYHRRAVETPWQRRFVERFAGTR